MGLLLDTHIAIWVVVDDPRLTDEARRSLLAHEGDLWVSAASIWEIAVKVGLKRGADPMPFGAREAIALFDEAGLRLLAITPQHAAATETLPPLHADPFDRLLVAQARTDGHRLLTADAALPDYGREVLAA